VSFVIGVDIGSQSVKALLLDPDGRAVRTASRPVRMSHPASGWAEQDPAEWESALSGTVRELMASGAAAPAEVAVLALACQVDGVVAVDADLRPLRPAIIWLDRRAEREARRLAEAVGGEVIFGRTGLVPDATHMAPKMMWLYEHEPAVAAQVRSFAPVASYLLARLTGISAQDPANASSTLLFDLVEGRWCERLCAAARVDPALLPPVRSAGELAGALTTRAADALGLTTRTAVCVGTGDEHAASVAAGAVHPGVIADVTGTAEPVTVAALEPVFDPHRLVETHAHAVDGRYLVENPGFVSGGSTLWLAEKVLGRPQADVFSLAAHAPAGSDGVLFLPALSGATAPRWNSGMRGAFAGLAMTTGAGHLTRAVIEGCAFALRDIVDRLDALGLAGNTGAAGTGSGGTGSGGTGSGGTGEVRVVGGGGRSRLWCQIKADVLDRPLRRLLTAEATAMGAAMLAGVAAGTFADIDDAVARGVRLDPEPIVPEPAGVAVYAEAYSRYRRLFDHVEEALA
jgi:xylulokinase